jgi:ribonuclease P protein component
MDETLRPHERLRKRKDFLHIYRNGTRYRGKNFILVYLSNNLRFSRIAVVASKKVGNALVRNKAKRRLRTLYRMNKNYLKESYDLVFITNARIRQATWKEIQKDFLGALEALSTNG